MKTMSDNDLIRRGVIKERMIARGWKHPDSTVTEFVEDDLPAADVKPVVLCKDCKHFTPMKCYENRGWCAWEGKTRYTEFYCANGERSEE